MSNLTKPLKTPQYVGTISPVTVCALLAEKLPLREARILRELAIQHGADSQDHENPDAIVQLLRARPAD